MGHLEFDRAVAAYKATLGAGQLQELLRCALTLEPEERWQHVRGKDTFENPFKEIRAVCDRNLSLEEVKRLAGCLGYALKATLAGEELSEAQVSYPVWEGRILFTVLEFGYNSASSARSAPDAFSAFMQARQFIFEGTPLRTTDREGKGTKDTRLVEGIPKCNLSLYVR